MKYSELKQKIKDLATAITVKKADLKKYQRENNGSGGSHMWDLYELKHQYRHHHVAASLLRGKTMEQIEPNAQFYKPWQGRYSDDIIKGIMDSVEPREERDEEALCDNAA
jgi:hypothetical protein